MSNVLKKSERVAVIDGVRTPFAKQMTTLKNMTSLDLAQTIVNELTYRHYGIEKYIEQLVYGQVILNPSIPNIAREVILGTRLKSQIDAYSISKACVSSLQATINICGAIKSGTIKSGIAGFACDRTDAAGAWAAWPGLKRFLSIDTGVAGLACGNPVAAGPGPACLA